MDKDTFSKVSAIALNNVFGYEPRISRNIIKTLGSAEAVFQLPQEERIRLFGGYVKNLSFINDSSLEDAERLYSKLLRDGCMVCSICDPDYPALLKDCDDAPAVLYMRSCSSAAEVFGREDNVSVVGTRDISPYGTEWCQRIVQAFAETPRKPLVVSGLAIGVDICAHRTALDMGLPTVAVLPVGIDSVYPLRHRRDAERIASTPGCALVTDYPPGTAPTQFNFLRRNRIIAGLSRATVLVESKIKGGGTMTARLAAGYGRDVFALPGRIDDVRSAGCNRLINEKLAESFDNLSILCEGLGLGQWQRRRSSDLLTEICSHFKESMCQEEIDALCRVAMEIKKERGISIEEICRRTDMNYAGISTLTGLLEADGFISIDLFGNCAINTRNC